MARLAPQVSLLGFYLLCWASALGHGSIVFVNEELLVALALVALYVLLGSFGAQILRYSLFHKVDFVYYYFLYLLEIALGSLVLLEKALALTYVQESRSNALELALLECVEVAAFFQAAESRLWAALHRAFSLAQLVVYSLSFWQSLGLRPLEAAAFVDASGSSEAGTAEPCGLGQGFYSQCIEHWELPLV